MFAGWETFYQMIGSAAGALMGLLFVVATLTGSLGVDKAQVGAKVYLTPTVFHFAAVLVASATTMVPHLSAPASAGLLGLAGVLGFLYAANVARMLIAGDLTEAPHWTDIWCYAVMPAGAYLVVIAAAAALEMGVFWAANLLAAALIGLLLLAIRNAWDLVTAIAPAAARNR